MKTPRLNVAILNSSLALIVEEPFLLECSHCKHPFHTRDIVCPRCRWARPDTTGKHTQPVKPPTIKLAVEFNIGKRVKVTIQRGKSPKYVVGTVVAETTTHFQVISPLAHVNEYFAKDSKFVRCSVIC